MAQQFSHHMMIGAYIRHKYGNNAVWEMQKTFEKNKKAKDGDKDAYNKYAMIVTIDDRVIAQSPDYPGHHKHGWYETKWGEILASVKEV
jgi:hypothetical protein